MEKKNSNKGYTLVELIIVVAIMAVVLTAIGLSMSLLFNNKVKAASRNVYNMLGAAQTLGMSKNNVYLKLSADDNGICSVGIVTGTSASDISEVEDKSIGSKLNLNLVVGTSSNKTAVDVSKTYYIGIDRKTGGFTGTYTVPGGGSIGDCLDIQLGGENNFYDIGLVKLTGKFFYK